MIPCRLNARHAMLQIDHFGVRSYSRIDLGVDHVIVPPPMGLQLFKVHGVTGNTRND